MFRKYFFISVLVSLFSQSALAQSQFGRYLGVLKHSQIEQDQLAKLDFIVSRQNSSEFKLVAVLSLYFGDYESREYVTYHFDSVTYNIVTGSMVFDRPDQEITLIADKFSGGRFEARLRSVAAGDVGVLSMSQDLSAVPTRPLVQPLWGEYRGLCDGVNSVLQVQTQRSTTDSSRMGDPFGTYETSAQLAEVNSDGCLGDSTLCVASVYDTGSYNFFNGNLNLQGRARELSCKVTAAGLACDNCSLLRSSNEAASLGAKVYPLQKGGFDAVPTAGGAEPAVLGTSTQLSGTYYGYVFHERLGVYQPVSLNIATYQGIGAAGTPALFVSAVSSMYFGDFASQEYVTHRFNEKEFPLLSPQIVLERIDADVDPVIQLTQLGNGKATGIWYSILFGRVGTFELTNGSLPPPPTGATIMSKISGQYEGGGWELDLRVTRESSPINTVNPFYPLNFKGGFRFLEVTPSIRIVAGAFDFYTGKLNMRLESNSIFSGFRGDNKTLSLKRPTPGVIRPLTPHQFQPFVRLTP